MIISYNAFSDWLLAVKCPWDKTSVPLMHHIQPLSKSVTFSHN